MYFTKCVNVLISLEMPWSLECKPILCISLIALPYMITNNLWKVASNINVICIQY